MIGGRMRSNNACDRRALRDSKCEYSGCAWRGRASDLRGHGVNERGGDVGDAKEGRRRLNRRLSQSLVPHRRLDFLPLPAADTGRKFAQARLFTSLHLQNRAIRQKDAHLAAIHDHAVLSAGLCGCRATRARPPFRDHASPRPHVPDQAAGVLRFRCRCRRAAERGV